MAGQVTFYNPTETNFNHVGHLITCLKAEISEEENALFFADFLFPVDLRITQGTIIKCNTHRGLQLFRITKLKRVVVKGKYYYSAYARHITFDATDYFLENIRPTNVSQDAAGKQIFSGTPFTFTSDVQGLNTVNYVRMDPLKALIGADNSLLNTWGGYLRRDNFDIKVLATSPNRGYTVEFGKNLVGIEVEEDVTNVVTRIMPTVVITNNIVTTLPENYIDSPLINKYPHPITREYRIQLTEEQKKLPIEEIYSYMRAYISSLFENGIDKPKVNYKIDFIQLGKTTQFKGYEVLEQLDMSDTVHTKCRIIDVSVNSRVIKIKWDGIQNRCLGMELGNHKPKMTDIKKDISKIVKESIDNYDGEISAKLKESIDLIIGNKGGYKVDLFNDLGQPTGTVWMDTPDVNTAQKYVLINNKGIAFGTSGLSTPPELAISIDGTIAGDSAFFRQIYTNLIQSELGRELNLESNEAITSRVTKDQIMTDADIQAVLKGDTGGDRYIR